MLRTLWLYLSVWLLRETIDHTKKFSQKNGGLLIIGGPTNSGTIHYTYWHFWMKCPIKLFFMEDPVEVLSPHVSHIQLRRDGLNPKEKFVN